MTLSTSIKSDERLIEPFRTVSSSKTLDTATTQGSKLQKNVVDKIVVTHKTEKDM